ncbi:importin-13 isoform X2 [Centruroides vittatus]|uniref:importin-13 isoform X2 n=1 Tax=Centruroides vittatus TaxID=120091 RepID=UPI0035109DA6
MDFSLETVERVLHEFYHDAESQAEANHYLTLLQISPEAWNIAWQLLNHSKTQEIQFFGANMLQIKISRFWHEIPAEQYISLRHKILETLINYAGGPKIVLTRLSVALSSYVIHTLPEHWPSAISDVISSLQPQNIPSVTPHQALTMLLELLTVLPEEFQTMHMPCSQRGIVRNALQSSVPQILGLVQEIFYQTDEVTNIHQMALKCYSSWSQLDPCVLEYEPLLLSTLKLVYNEELCQTALEALTNVVIHPESHKCPNSILKLVGQIIKLEDLLSKAIQEKDMDICCCIYGLFIALGETHSKLLLNTILEREEYRDTIIKLISLILQCSRTPGHYPIDEICSEQTFGFWYTLQDEIVASEPAKFESYLRLFHPLFQSLVDTYLIKIQYPTEDAYQQWHNDEKESFRCYRQDVGDSFMYCYNILRESMLANLMAHLSVAVNRASVNSSDWQYLESCLYAFQAIAESVDSEEKYYLPQFFSNLPKILLQNVQVISTTMDAIGSYAEWINVHPEVLEHVVPILMMGIQNTDVSPASTMALKDITRDCQPSLAPFAEQILSTSQEALSNLKSRERIRLMSTIGQVLSIMSLDYIMSYLETLLTPIIHQLQQTLTEQSSTSKTTIILNLNILSMLFSTLDIRPKDDTQTNKTLENKKDLPQPVFLVLKQVMPLLMTIASNWMSDEHITEALCDTLKRATSTLLEECQPLIDDILQLLLHIYQFCPHNSVLDVSKQMMMLFGQDKERKAKLMSFFAQICAQSISLFRTNLRENTTVVEILFEMLTQVVKKIPYFLENEDVDLAALFQCSIVALCLPEKPTVKAASSFIAEFINRSREISAMLNVVNNHGEFLVGQVLKVIGGEAPRSMVEHMPDILMALNKKYFDNLCRWMSTFLQQQDFPSQHVSPVQKEHFTRMVLRERSNKRKLKETVSEFSLICRGLIGSEYAAKTTGLT